MIIPLHDRYRRLHHFEEYLNILQGTQQDNYDDITPLIQKHFEFKPQLTWNDLREFFLNDSRVCGIDITPKLLHLLGAPWKKYKFFEYSKLVLLANRFDKNSILYKIPIDIGKFMKICYAIRVYLFFAVVFFLK